MTIGERIIYFRELRGFTTNKLANLSGISQSFLRDVEMNNKGISVENLSVICDALKVSLRDFFDMPEENDSISTELLSAINKLSSEQQIKLLNFIKSL